MYDYTGLLHMVDKLSFALVMILGSTKETQSNVENLPMIHSSLASGGISRYHALAAQTACFGESIEILTAE